MPGTMRMLMGSANISRRTDVRVATTAAAKLLAQNYAETKSWPLALTAYNHGLAGVMRAVRQTGSRDLCVIIDRYESPSFRFASSNFYAQFLAARRLALGHYIQLAKRKGSHRVLKEVLATHTTKKNPS
jgi:membrane-bound lytic murein transglycosylase D